MAFRICPECGGKVAYSRDNCMHCGYEFGSQVKYCSECGQALKVDDEVCDACGSYNFVYGEIAEKQHSEECVDVATKMRNELLVLENGVHKPFNDNDIIATNSYLTSINGNYLQVKMFATKEKKYMVY